MAKNFLGKGVKVIDADHTAGAAHVPGTSVKLNASGAFVVTADTDERPLAIVLPDTDMGKDNTDAYAVGDRINVGYVQPGQTAYAFVNENQARGIGTLLKNVGSGYLARTTTDGQEVAILLEAHTASTSATLRRVRGV